MQSRLLTGIRTICKYTNDIIVQVQKKLEETTKKADKSDTDYSHSVNNLKAIQDRFYDNEMPAILKVRLITMTYF